MTLAVTCGVMSQEHSQACFVNLLLLHCCCDGSEKKWFVGNHNVTVILRLNGFHIYQISCCLFWSAAS